MLLFGHAQKADSKAYWVQVEVPLTTSKVEDTLQAIQGRKEYYLKKRQDVKDGNTDEAEVSSSAKTNGAAADANGNATAEEFEHVSLVCLHVAVAVIAPASIIVLL